MSRRGMFHNLLVNICTYCVKVWSTWRAMLDEHCKAESQTWTSQDQRSRSQERSHPHGYGDSSGLTFAANSLFWAVVASGTHLAKITPVYQKKSQVTGMYIWSLELESGRRLKVSFLLQSIRMRYSGCAPRRHSPSAVIQQRAPLVRPVPRSLRLWSLYCEQCCDHLRSARHGCCAPVGCTHSWPNTARSTPIHALPFTPRRCWICPPSTIPRTPCSHWSQWNILATCWLLPMVEQCLLSCYWFKYFSYSVSVLVLVCLAYCLCFVTGKYIVNYEGCWSLV